MCRKLGKGHPDYISRKDGQYRPDEHGVMRMRRMHNGVRVDKHYGANMLNTYTDLRDKLFSWYPARPTKRGVEETPLKISATKKAHLERMSRHTNHGMTRNWPQRREHFARNNVCLISYLRDNRS